MYSTPGKEETISKKRKVDEYDGYTDAAWGDVTCGWVSSSKRLSTTTEKGKVVLDAAVSNINFSIADNEEEQVGVKDPRALVEIW